MTQRPPDTAAPLPDANEQNLDRLEAHPAGTSKPREHWERAYRSNAPEKLSWFQKSAARSLELIHSTGLPKGAAIVDAGGGASPLAGELIAGGFRNVTVIDISASALAAARSALGAAADRVRWIVGDVLEAPLREGSIDLWHDRAVYHFLVDPADRRAYAGRLRKALTSGGFALLATFAEDGPTKCSGLPTMRYGTEALAAELGKGFDLVSHEREEHRTPTGGAQRFNYCLFRVARGPSGALS